MHEHEPTSLTPEQPTNEAADQDGDSNQERERDAAIADIEARAQELGLTPEETTEAVAEYKDSLTEQVPVGDEVEGEEKPESSEGMSVDELLQDPSGFMNRLSERAPLQEAGALDGLEASISKLIEDVEGAEGLVNEVEGLKDVFKRFMELLIDALKLILYIISMLEEREKLETQEEKDDLTREIQEKINEFGAKYGEG